MWALHQHAAPHADGCSQRALPLPSQIGQRLSDAAFSENLTELDALVKSGANINTHDNVGVARAHRRRRANMPALPVRRTASARCTAAV